MKLIFSRKGFDAGNGGVPSPILPAGRLLPLPIPASHGMYTFDDVRSDDIDLPCLLSDLTGGRLAHSSPVHLDPDLDRQPEARSLGWRPALGQTGAAQGHLANQGVGVGDVFLFFGWFREVEQAGAMWRYVPTAPDLHVLFGWLEVGDVVNLSRERQRGLAEYPWIGSHPHVAEPGRALDEANTLYIAREVSTLASRGPGGGRFQAFAPSLQLTAEGRSRSIWSLPGWFQPKHGRPALSYHGREEAWSRQDERVLLQSAAKGQEFVIDNKFYPELDNWLEDLIATNA